MLIGAKDNIRIYLPMASIANVWRMSVITDIEADVATLFSILGNRFSKNNIYGTYNPDKEIIGLKLINNSKKVSLHFELRSGSNSAVPFIVEVMKNNDSSDEPIATYIVSMADTVFNLEPVEGGFDITSTCSGALLTPGFIGDICTNNGENIPLSDAQLEEIANYKDKVLENSKEKIISLNKELAEKNQILKESEKNIDSLKAELEKLEAENDRIADELSNVPDIDDDYIENLVSNLDKELEVSKKERTRIIDGYKTQIDISDKGFRYNKNSLDESENDKLEKEWTEIMATLKTLINEAESHEAILEKIEEKSNGKKNI